jgi:hypothetical protein
MHLDLRIAARDWARLRRHFQVSFGSDRSLETGALAVLGECRTNVKQEFIVAEVLLPEQSDLKYATNGALVFDASFIRRAHLAMRKQRLAGIATFHTHPGPSASVDFSLYDDRQDPLLVENLMEIEPRTQFVSVVAGREAQSARFFANPRSSHPLDRLIVVGDHLSYLPLDGHPPPPPPPPAAIFDRGLRLTGSGALAVLAGMTIAVVGASGTGSLICELLARAGCKHIILIDHDIVQVINLNRILYATEKDARRGAPKVEVLRRGIEALKLGCLVEPVCGSVLDTNILRRVLDSDLVLGCVDRALPRHLLCELAARYLLPYIDVGSEIGGDEDGIVSLDSRVSYIAPGRPCLTCTGVVTPRRLRFESLTEGERQRDQALGYSDDLVLKQPAVMDLNMRAASGGMLVLRHLLQPFLKEPLPVEIHENAVTYRTIPASTAKAADPTCPTCQKNARCGHGDCGPQIGYDPETASRLLGSDSIDTAAPSRRFFHKISPLRMPHFLHRANEVVSTMMRRVRR